MYCHLLGGPGHGSSEIPLPEAQRTQHSSRLWFLLTWLAQEWLIRSTQHTPRIAHFLITSWSNLFLLLLLAAAIFPSPAECESNPGYMVGTKGMPGACVLSCNRCDLL